MLAVDDIDSRNSTIQRKVKQEEEIYQGPVCEESTNTDSPTMSATGNNSAMDGVTTNLSSENSAGNQPSINWNVGNKVKIRTTLGAARSESRVGLQSSGLTPQPDVSQATESNPSQNGLDLELENLQVQAASQIDTQTAISQSREQPSTAKIRPPETGSDSLQISEDDADSDGGIALNLVSDEQSDESGEVHENHDQGLDGHQDVEMKVEGATVQDDEISVQDEETDAMIDYSKARPNPASFPSGDNPSSQKDQVRILADLKPDDLQLQFRYFYIAQDPRTIDLNDPVRCLACKGAHTSDSCTSKLRHDKQDGPSGSKRPISGAMCNLCHEVHLGTCEMLWRTSGLPQNLSMENPQIRLSCYECGRYGHLGNDCPTRRPHKTMGSSTWTIVRNKQSSKGISIRGRADQKKPIVIDDSEDDQANFLRSRLTSQKTRMQAADANVLSNPGIGHITVDIRGQLPGQPDDRQRGHTPPRSRPRRGVPSEPRRRRSRSPGLSSCSNRAVAGYRHRDVPPKDYDGASDNRTPGSEASFGQAGTLKTPRRRRPKKKMEVNTYRPMPSAAQNAWVRHRT